MDKLGSSLQNLRLKRNYTQSYVAKKLNVSENTIGYWENNTWKPSAEHLVGLVILYNVSMNDVLDRQENIVDLIGLTDYQLNVLFRIIVEFKRKKSVSKSIVSKNY